MSMLGFLRGLAAALTLAAAAVPAAAQTVQSEKATFRVVTVTRGLEYPWGLAFLPDGAMLVTERPGRLRLIRNGAVVGKAIEGVPQVRPGGQGGLLDVALHPDFARNRLVYLTYSCPGREGAATCVARGRFENNRLQDVRTIFEAGPKVSGNLHFGSRIAFGPDGMLYVSLGERYRRDLAQRLDQLRGKIVRLRDDGSVPPDNPFAGKDGARPEIYTYGHRNPQGLAFQPGTGRLWEIEHGPQGGDELNLIQAGRNYGWPVITNGIDYDNSPIGEGKSKPGMENPVRAWVPSISPSGLAFYTGSAFPGWRGSVFLGGLSGQVLVRLELDGTRVTHEERLLAGSSRIRDVRQGPDGKLWLLTDDYQGEVLRLDPTS